MKALIAAIFTTILLVPASTPEADDIIGLWLPGEGTAHIRIFRQKDKPLYFGRIVWLKDPLDEHGKPKLDDNGKPILDMINLRDFEFKKGSWTNGTIYDPKSGNTYYCSIEMEGNDKLQVRGSVDRWGLLGRTDTWTRVKP